MIPTLIIAIATIIALFICLIFVFLWEWSLLITQAPFVPIPQEVIPDIISALQLTADSVVYDLGCGDGRVLLACCQSQPKARYYGIDKAIIPILFAKFKTSQTPINILRKNFFQHDLSHSTHIFTYLFPGLMNELLPKFIKELRHGTRLVSCDFTFQDKPPARVIKLNRPKRALAQTLYIYEF